MIFTPWSWFLPPQNIIFTPLEHDWRIVLAVIGGGFELQLGWFCFVNLATLSSTIIFFQFFKTFLLQIKGCFDVIHVGAGWFGSSLRSLYCESFSNPFGENSSRTKANWAILKKNYILYSPDKEYILENTIQCAGLSYFSKSKRMIKHIDKAFFAL